MLPVAPTPVLDSAATACAVVAATAWVSAAARRRARKRALSPLEATERPLAGLALFTSFAIAVKVWNAEIGTTVWLGIAMAAGGATTLIAPRHARLADRLPGIALMGAVLAALTGRG